MDLFEFFRNLVSFFVVLLFSLCFHEYAHGWVARLRGDDTAERMGRLTLNPIPHMDPIGTVILPVLTIFFNASNYNLPLFGWAKPVPVNIRNLKAPRTDMFWIALAGPLSNVLLALAGAAVWAFAGRTLVTTPHFSQARDFLLMFVQTNLFLAIFNIIPLHPLDGGKVLARFLPHSINHKLEENEHITSMILLMLILFGFVRILAIPVVWLFDLIIVGVN